uniref:Reverse transcriptase zinc-binding domain-containing protein n=1 Tax=Cannabis sativa TaxID=3483 RepID=A0A803PIJ5_CANSA
MAKTRAKNVGKPKASTKKIKKKGPTSTADAKKMKSMDEVLGVKPMEFTDEEDGEGDSDPLRDLFQPPLSPKSSLQSIIQREEVATDFGHFLSANKKCQDSILKGQKTTPPILRSGTVMRNLESSFADQSMEKKVRITLEDIEAEVSYWKSAIVCYVLGANPPLSMLEGFARRIWKDKVDKIGMISYGIFIIRFTSSDIRDEVLAGGLEDLELKYWGQRSLFKLIGQLGKPLMMDEVTKGRDKLACPRVLIESIEEAWRVNIHGTNMYQVVTKMKALKQVFKGINQQGFSDIQASDLKAKSNLQKSKVNWIKDGDANMTFYHSSLRDRRAQNRIISSIDTRGDRVDKVEEVTEAFMEYHKQLLGSKLQQRKKVKLAIIAEGHVVSKEQAEALLAEYISEEIKQAVFDVSGIKSPGPDGLAEDMLLWHRLRTGLLPNNSKSAMYCSGMSEDEVRRVLDMSGFTRHHDPFKYMGVPICARKIAASDCSSLVQKMTSNIKTWSARNLSFAGGLGPMYIPNWNSAAMIKHVWAVEKKKDNLWVKWVHCVYIKQQAWWEYKAPMNGSWYWRKMVEIKEKIRLLVQQDVFAAKEYKIVDGYIYFEQDWGKVSWSNLVWSRLNVPKHSFLLWLAMVNRLKAQDRLFKHGLIDHDFYTIYNTATESAEHLFFSCSFASACLSRLKEWMRWNATATSLQSLMKWVRKAKISRFKRMYLQLGLLRLFTWCGRLGMINFGK